MNATSDKSVAEKSLGAESTVSRSATASMVPIVYALTLVFAALPWFIRISVESIDHPEASVHDLLLSAYPELAFIPITLVLYTIGLAAENLEHIGNVKRGKVFKNTALAGVGGLICLCSYFIFVAREEKFLVSTGNHQNLEYFFFGSIGITIFSSWLASMTIHKSRQIGAERNV